MQVFDPTRLDTAVYRSVINQSGSGMEMDRYIYSNQSGEGIGSFFGNLLRTAIPLIGRTIKGAAVIAKPHLENAGKDIIAAGSKRALSTLVNYLEILFIKYTQLSNHLNRERGNGDEIYEQSSSYPNGFVTLE